MEIKREVYKIIDKKMNDKFGTFTEISDYVFNHPELGGEEFESSAYICKYLENEGFFVERPYKEIPTAFVAEYRPESLKKDARVMAFIAEYDALPGFGENGGPGHACGHNWIAASMCGCAVSLSAAADMLNCIVRVIGTPAEETFGAKYNMIKKGCFDDVSIAFQAHLDEFNSIETLALAMNSIEFSFHGVAAHAAQNPEKGVNALDAVISMYNNINAMRQHICDDDRIHGIITSGGAAANIVPDFAQCQFGIRSKTKKGLETLRNRIINIAEAAALATGTRLEYRYYENPYDDMVNIKSLTELCKRHFSEYGYVDFIPEEDYPGSGSSDIGNVSYVCPTVYLEIAPKEGDPIIVHEQSAMMQVNSPHAVETMKPVISAYTHAAADICMDKHLYETIYSEHKEKTMV